MAAEDQLIRALYNRFMQRLTLTFDNGPSPDVTAQVLDLLAERQLLATFCIVGRRLLEPGAADIIRRAVGDGHRIVNHSMNHQTPLGADPSTAHAAVEIRDMHELMTTTLGHWGAPWFRPFGRGGTLGRHVFSQAAVNELSTLRYSILLWNSVPRDWIDPTGWVDTALNSIGSNEHTVVVLHDTPTGAMDHLPRFLDALDSRRIEIDSEFPTECVPMVRGIPNSMIDALIAQ